MSLNSPFRVGNTCFPLFVVLCSGSRERVAPASELVGNEYSAGSLSGPLTFRAFSHSGPLFGSHPFPAVSALSNHYFELFPFSHSDRGENRTSFNYISIGGAESACSQSEPLTFRATAPGGPESEPTL